MIGVLFGSAVIPPILGLMYDAFGFVGAPGATEGFARGPQAGLLKDLTQGVLGGDLDWGLIGVGALIGAGVIVIDEVLTRTSRFRLPPPAVGWACTCLWW